MADNSANQHPEIAQAVLDEVKKLGENYKTNYDTLRTNYEDLKSLVEMKSDDVVTKERIEKYATDIAVRQEELDKRAVTSQKAIHDRMDQLEVAFKRPGGFSGVLTPDAEKEIKQFYTAVASLKDDGMTFEKMKTISLDAEAYKTYCSAFQDYLRKAGDDRKLSADQYKALMVGSDPAGGYTVTPQMMNAIITRQWELDPLRSLANVETITSGAMEQLVDWDEAGYGWESETVATPETTTPKFYKKRIDAFVAAARPRATQTLLDDSGINIEQWLANKIANKLARVEGAAFISGDGVGKPRGFLTYANGTTYGTVEQINMGHATLLTADGFVNIKYHLNEYYLNSNSLTWLMARSTVAAAMILKDGLGGYIWKPAMIASDPSSSILGIPVRMSPSMPVVAANALSVAIADWREAYTIVDRLGISVQRDPYTVKPFIEFYTRKRVGGDVVNYDSLKIGVIAV